MPAASAALTAALPSRSQVDRGSRTVHAAAVRWVPFADTGFHYPVPAALCGAPVWGPYGAGEPGCCLNRVNCGGCRRTTVWKLRTGHQEPGT